MYKFKFADIGEGLHEGKVGEIFKNVGDIVKEGEDLFLVETDKVSTNIPSPVSGKITWIGFTVGQIIRVGEEIYHFETYDLTKESKIDSGASVVGEVKVSNELFDFNNIAKKHNENAKEKIIKNDANTFQWKDITPIGNGEKVDAVIIGAGPGGYTAGEFLSKLGLKTIIIEKEYAGGVCLNVGCIPTKTLLKSAQVLELIKNAENYGLDINIDYVKLNWNKMLERKNNISNLLKSGIESLLKASKVELIKGNAEIIDRYNIKVDNRKFTTKIIVIASGSTPITIPIENLDNLMKKNIVIDSSGALSLPQIPKTFVIIGGGVIGVEFASLYNTLGSKVTIIEGGDFILNQIDKDLKKFIIDKLIKDGINIITKAKVKNISENTIHYEINGEIKTIVGEKILLSIGRKPNNLSLDKTLNIQVDKKGAIIVNDFMQTNINNIFAIGDVVGKSMLAHTAYKHAHVVADFISGKKKTWNINHVPACIYTHPELAMIGQTEDQLISENANYISSIWLNKNVGKVLADGDKDGFTKLLINKEDGAILGAHIINSNASDMIAEIATLIELEGTVYELADTIHPHPSISEVIYEAAVHAVEKLKK